MNEDARQENIRSLADLLGSGEKEATQLLNITALVTFEQTDERSSWLADHIHLILSRTIERVAIESGSKNDPEVEIIIGSSSPCKECPRVYVTFRNGSVVTSISPSTSDDHVVEPIALLLATCYICAAAMKRILEDRLPYPVPDTLTVNLAELLGEDGTINEETVEFDEAFLAGAGAIGNGFVLAAALLPLTGDLHVVDDDTASGGNLQRCVLFGEDSIDSQKAELLANAGKRISEGRLNCIPHNVVLQRVPQRKEGAWLRRLIVGVDSPRARRQLQCEMPGEVFDASTTGAEEIVLHFHKQPTDEACLACAYHHNPQEHAREVHIAESLGVTIAEVRELRVSQHSANNICMRYPHLNKSEVVGLAYDSLFKALCSSSKLMTPEGRQVITPFAFVSVLAGTMLAIEFYRRVRRGDHVGLYNEWRISPWSNPVFRGRRSQGRRPDCQFCGDSILRDLATKIWRSN